MKISLNWLKKFVDIKEDPHTLAEKLTEHTVEIEEVISEDKYLDKVVVGEIKEIKPHPNADKLKLCMTDIGSGSTVQIVCGGANIYEGMKVAVALPGAKVRWHGEGEWTEIGKAKIRGEESYGMICASAEIGLAESTDKQEEGPDGVMDLNTDAACGTQLSEALNLDDVILDIDNKSITHRPDLWSHIGIAREVSAIFKRKLKADAYFDIPKIEKGLSGISISDDISIFLNEEICRRYIAVYIKNIKIEESPDWLKKQLLSIGQRPVNNIVDITNYVMFEVGQPLHAFDAVKVKSKDGKFKVKVDYGKKDLTIKALDEKEYAADDTIPLIYIDDKPSAIAGVMGGFNSEVDSSTEEILLESANFIPQVIRLASKKLDLRTEASSRFEKNINLQSPMIGVWRFIQVLKEVCPQAEVVYLRDEKLAEEKEKEIVITKDYIDRTAGCEIPESEIESIFKYLGFMHSVKNGEYRVKVPFWRQADINIKEDIAEEVIRIYGYNNIKGENMRIEGYYSDDVLFSVRERQVKRFLTFAGGVWEVENHSFDNDKIAEVLHLDENRWEIENPLSQECRYLRKSLLPNMLQNVKDNLRFYEYVNIFEIGRVFPDRLNDDLLPDQPYRLGIIMASKNLLNQELFIHLKGVVERMFDYLGVEAVYELGNFDGRYAAQNQALYIYLEGKPIGYMAVIDESVLKQIKIQVPVVYAEIDWDYLSKVEEKEIKYRKFALYPAVDRDISVIVDKSIAYSEVEKVIRESSDLLESLRLFDVYTGRQIGEGKKSYAWHLYFRAEDRTLTSEEVNKEVDKIIKNLASSLGAQVRK